MIPGVVCVESKAHKWAECVALRGFGRAVALAAVRSRAVRRGRCMGKGERALVRRAGQLQYWLASWQGNSERRLRPLAGSASPLCALIDVARLESLGILDCRDFRAPALAAPIGGEPAGPRAIQEQRTIVPGQGNRVSPEGPSPDHGKCSHNARDG